MSGKIWSVLLHLGGNMWNEEGNIRGRESCPDAVASQKLRFSRPVLDRYLKRLAGLGVGLVGGRRLACELAGDGDEVGERFVERAAFPLVL